MGDEKIAFEQKGLSFFGLFRQGSRAQGLPLIVLIHGGGATSAFFDNPVISYVCFAHTPDYIEKKSLISV